MLAAKSYHIFRANGFRSSSSSYSRSSSEGNRSLLSVVPLASAVAGAILLLCPQFNDQLVGTKIMKFCVGPCVTIMQFS